MSDIQETRGLEDYTNEGVARFPEIVQVPHL